MRLRPPPLLSVRTPHQTTPGAKVRIFCGFHRVYSIITVSKAVHDLQLQHQSAKSLCLAFFVTKLLNGWGERIGPVSGRIQEPVFVQPNRWVGEIAA